MFFCNPTRFHASRCRVPSAGPALSRDADSRGPPSATANSTQPRSNPQIFTTPLYFRRSPGAALEPTASCPVAHPAELLNPVTAPGSPASLPSAHSLSAVALAQGKIAACRSLPTGVLSSSASLLSSADSPAPKYRPEDFPSYPSASPLLLSLGMKPSEGGESRKK